MNSLVSLKNNEPITTSKIIADGVGNKHKNVMELIQRHEERIKKLRGILPFETEKTNSGKRGRPSQFYILNEIQTTFLISLMDNSEKVLNFKEALVIEFYRMRSYIQQQRIEKESEEYKRIRSQSKIGRLQETDVIKIFVEYATKQGSKSTNMYYMHISKMENSAFFILKEKYKNVREILNITQLSKIIVADMIIRQALIEGMDKEMNYKDIFYMAKERVVALSNSLGFKDIIPTIDHKQINS